MDIVSLIAMACLHKEPDKTLACKSTAMDCVVKTVRNPDDKKAIDKCLSKGKEKLKRSCYERLPSSVNLNPETIVHNLSICNDLILDRMFNVRKNHLAANGEQMSLEEAVNREFLTIECMKIGRNLFLLCKE